MQQVPEGSIGIFFVIEFLDNCDVVDVSSAVTKQIVWTKPDGTKVTNVASFRTTGTDGQIQYLTLLASELTPIGIWKVYGRVTMPGNDWFTIPQQFEVIDL